MIREADSYGRPVETGFRVQSSANGRLVNTPPIVSRTTCAGTTKKGEACRAPIANGGDYCIGHMRQVSARA